uniref:NADH-ubiquinone oxidoreductase chain 2 n=1 Tax=Demodex folliculorum TaxID=481310 RepID=A0A0A7DUC4_DEMFO|nr:NADH dehydrogenase subunit 2 [Demodex folliculorum]AIW82499.1 NADH dehydrogenase subunit 2 [Demodex folliculorum]
MLILSSLLGLSSNSWIILWFMLEVNSPMFSMLMIYNKENPSNPLNYFIFQTLPSMVLLMLILNMFFKTPINSKNSIPSSLLSLVSFMKMGMAPLHNWMLAIMKSLKKKSIMTILTIQKILPLKVLCLSSLNPLALILILLNLITSNIMILNYNKLFNILMSSSLFNMSWMSLSINSSPKLCSIYFLTYSYLTTFLIIYSFKMNLKSMNIPNQKFSPNFLCSILSLSGIPPLWGFMNKLILINLMITNNTPKLMILILLASSVLMLAGYLKLTFSMLMKNIKNSMNMKKENLTFLIFNLVSPFSITML